MNKNLLRSIMVLHEDTNGKLANFLNITQNRLSAKMNEWNDAQFTQVEIKKIKERYNLTAEQVDSIFFN